jgi:hypothetical protein
MSIHFEPVNHRAHALTLSLAAVALLTSAACSTKRDAAPADTTAPRMPAPAESSAAAPDSAPPPVRGTIAAVSDSTVTITTAAGAQQIRIAPPLRVYARTKSDLAHVRPNAFVGITSVTAPDGSQRATEIHVFPEELRGTGEGSRMMAQTGAGAAGGSRMTNGAVAPSRMTNGSVSGSGSRMTNGSVSSTGSGTSYTIQYRGGTQTIEIPPGVPVTEIAPTKTKLAPGSSVVAIVRKGPDGRPVTSTIMLSGSGAPK